MLELSLLGQEIFHLAVALIISGIFFYFQRSYWIFISLIMTDHNLPSLSIVIVNRNDAKRLQVCLEHISQQSYPKSQIEILVVDGGSSDNSQEVAEKFGAVFIDGGYPENMEARRAIGVKKAKNEILVFIDTDNYLPDENWFKEMIEPLTTDPEIFASQTLWYAYRRQDKIFNRYCALFGFNDPVAFYLGKADRMTHYQKKWSLNGKAQDCGNYYKAEFTPDNLPTVGCNGFLIRRQILEQVVTEPERFFHIDVIYDLVQKGHKSLAFVKNDIIHDTSASLFKLIKKRLSYCQNHNIELQKYRRYQVFDSQKSRNKLSLLKYIIYSLTIIKPLFDAIRGFIRKPDLAWFMHPVACLFFLGAYGFTVIKSKVKSH